MGIKTSLGKYPKAWLLDFMVRVCLVCKKQSNCLPDVIRSGEERCPSLCVYFSQWRNLSQKFTESYPLIFPWPEFCQMPSLTRFLARRNGYHDQLGETELSHGHVDRIPFSETHGQGKIPNKIKVLPSSKKMGLGLGQETHSVSLYLHHHIRNSRRYCG